MRIALVSAYPIGFNPGMLSVDLAWDEIFAANNSDAQHSYTRFNFQRAADFADANGELAVLLESSDQLNDFDRVVYWGDFLQWQSWYQNDLTSRNNNMGLGKTPEQVLDACFDVFLLENNPELQAKVVIFGSTLVGVTAQQLQDDRYRNALVSLISNARMVRFRDVYSTNFANLLVPTARASLGCDAALLSSPQSLNFEVPEYAVYSFGRSGRPNDSRELAVELGRQAGIPVVDADWLGCSGPQSLQQKLALVRGAKWVFTDVYHLSVTAIREGIPVALLGKGVERTERTISDKKKETLFTQYLLNDWYFFVESSLDGLDRQEAAKHVVWRVYQREEFAAARRMVLAQTRALRAEIEAVLF